MSLHESGIWTCWKKIHRPVEFCWTEISEEKIRERTEQDQMSTLLHSFHFSTLVFLVSHSVVEWSVCRELRSQNCSCLLKKHCFKHIQSHINKQVTMNSEKRSQQDLEQILDSKSKFSLCLSSIDPISKFFQDTPTIFEQKADCFVVKILSIRRLGRFWIECFFVSVTV